MDVEEETASLESPPQPDGQEPALPHLKPRVTGHNPGEEVDLRDMAYPGRTTIFDFYSDYCPPCRQISPLLEALNRNRDDIVVIKIDINRPGVRGIDWRSPVARQHRLPSIPYFVIYDSHRRESHSGDSARERVFELLREEKIY
jgi:thiol-disulfide isomerase/thioredoxin